MGCAASKPPDVPDGTSALPPKASSARAPPSAGPKQRRASIAPVDPVTDLVSTAAFSPTPVAVSPASSPEPSHSPSPITVQEEEPARGASLEPLPSQQPARKLKQKSKPFWEREQERKKEPPPAEGPATTPPSQAPQPVVTADLGESAWEVEEFDDDDNVASPARPSPARVLPKPTPQSPLAAKRPLPTLAVQRPTSLAAHADEEPSPGALSRPPQLTASAPPNGWAPLAPARPLVARPGAGLSSLAELPPLPLPRQPAGGRAASTLPDPKMLPSVLGGVHGGTRPRGPKAAGGGSGGYTGSRGSSAPSSRDETPRGEEAEAVPSISLAAATAKAAAGGAGRRAGRRLTWAPSEVKEVVLVARPEREELQQAADDYKRNLRAISHLRQNHMAGTPFRELVRVLDVAEGGEALPALVSAKPLPSPAPSPAQPAAAAATWGELITPLPAVAAY